MYLNTQGVVINRRFHLENDKVISVYTREIGKVNAVAVGSRKINARFISVTEPIVEAEFAFASTRSNLPKVVGCRPITFFPGLKNDFSRFSTACKVAEVVDVLTFGNMKNEKKYDLIKRTFELLETAKNPGRIYTAFLMRFLQLSGYGLELQKCIKCFNAPSDSLLGFSLHNRGVLCSGCFDSDPDALGIDYRTLSVFRNMGRLSGEDIDAMRIHPETEKLIDNQCRMYLAEYTHRFLKTEQVISEAVKFKHENTETMP